MPLDLHKIKLDLIAKRNAKLAELGGHVFTENGRFKYISQSGRTYSIFSFDYAWHKMHYLYAWLKAIGAPRVPAFLTGDKDYYGTMRGYELMKRLETLVKYECNIRNTHCDAFHPFLVGLEGEEVELVHNGKNRVGVVTVQGDEIRYYEIIKPRYKRGRRVMPWDTVEVISLAQVC